MPILHARSTSTCAPDITLLRPRTPNNEGFIGSADFTNATSQWRMPVSAPQTPQLIQPLVWQVPQSKEWQAEEPLLELKEHGVPPREQHRRRNSTVLATLWVVSLMLASMITYVATKQAPGVRLHSHPLGTFEDGFSTELEPALSSIRVRNQPFHGSLDFKAHHGFIPPDSPSQKYVGSGPAVDAAWDELTHDRYFLLSDDEAKVAYGPDPSRYWNVHHGGYIAGLDVLHTLHCLNHLRMGLYPHAYQQDPDSQMHRAHCVDHLRQLAMCHADLTPVPTQWFKGLDRNYINSSQPHTCRDFSLVRDWATERFNGSTAVKPRNRDGSPRADFYAPWTP